MRKTQTIFRWWLCRPRTYSLKTPLNCFGTTSLLLMCTTTHHMSPFEYLLMLSRCSNGDWSVSIIGNECRLSRSVLMDTCWCGLQAASIVRYTGILLVWLKNASSSSSLDPEPRNDAILLTLPMMWWNNCSIPRVLVVRVVIHSWAWDGVPIM